MAAGLAAVWPPASVTCTDAQVSCGSCWCVLQTALHFDIQVSCLAAGCSHVYQQWVPVAAAGHCFVSGIPCSRQDQHDSTVSAHLRWLIDPAADKQQASTQSPASLPPCHAAAAQPLPMHCKASAHGSCAYSYLATASHSAGMHNEPVLAGIRSCPILHAVANSCTSQCIGVLRAARCSQKDRCQQVQPLVLMPVVLAAFGQRCGRPTGAAHDAAAVARAASSRNKQQVPCTL